MAEKLFKKRGALFRSPPPGHSGICAVDLLRAGTVPGVVVDDAAGLKVGVEGDGPQVFESPLLQFFADFFRKSIAHRNLSFIIMGVEDRLPIGKAPEPR